MVSVNKDHEKAHLSNRIHNRLLVVLSNLSDFQSNHALDLDHDSVYFRADGVDGDPNSEGWRSF